MCEFIYIIRPTRIGMLSEGPTEREAEVIERHAAYLQRLCDEGEVLLAGRTLVEDERAFGIVILRVPTEDRARGIMRADPAVAEGVMSAELLPYRVAMMRAAG